MNCGAKKQFTQCFWHADGTLTCDKTVVPSVTPSSYVQFDTFSKGNQNYTPNAYRAQRSWYEKQAVPCCSVPCYNNCPEGTRSSFSPPRDQGKLLNETQ